MTTARASRWRLILPCITVTWATAASAQTAPSSADSGALALQSFSLIVRDYDEALRWYTQKLGFAVVRDQAFGAGGQRFVMVAPARDAATAIVLQHYENNGGDTTMTATYGDRIGKQVNIVLRTSDVTAAYERMKSRGVVFSMPPRQQPWGGEALFSDLYGNTFVLVGPLRRR
jgi:uncharacterized glyoxalase superfamily protein PhnB